MADAKLPDLNKKPFLSDIQEIRRRAREHIRQGAVTPSYRADLHIVLKLLDEALATELVCILRYKNHYFMAEGLNAPAVAVEFLEHAGDEQLHADQLARRIRQLGGKPNMNPATLTARSHAEYTTSDDLREMIEEDLVAERIAIESYREMAQYMGEKDPTSRRLMEEILAKEEEHADDMASLLFQLEATAGRKSA